MTATCPSPRALRHHLCWRRNPSPGTSSPAPWLPDPTGATGSAYSAGGPGGRTWAPSPGILGQGTASSPGVLPRGPPGSSSVQSSLAPPRGRQEAVLRAPLRQATSRHRQGGPRPKASLVFGATRSPGGVVKGSVDKCGGPAASDTCPLCPDWAPTQRRLRSRALAAPVAAAPPHQRLGDACAQSTGDAIKGTGMRVGRGSSSKAAATAGDGPLKPLPSSFLRPLSGATATWGWGVISARRVSQSCPEARGSRPAKARAPSRCAHSRDPRGPV